MVQPESAQVRCRLASAKHVRTEFESVGGNNFEEASAELERFFDLTSRTDSPLALISKNIDLLWHKLLEFTEFYRSYCSERYGYFIDHRPRTAATPVPAEAVLNFYRQYERQYGEVGDVWEADAPADIVAYGRGRIAELPELRWSGWPGREGGSTPN